jgi:acetyl-CoA carboxylase carboxyltransferase component
MGLEGAVKAGFRKELDACETPEKREKLFNKILGQLYDRGKAVNMASYLEIDAVIDPVDTRKWIMKGLLSAPMKSARDENLPFVDPV